MMQTDAEDFRFEQAKNQIIGKNRKKNGIGTLGEKTVHAVMKYYYDADEEHHEIPIESYVADIFTGKEIVEIQTRQLGNMRSKLETFLPLYPVTVVYPIPREKYLIWVDETDGEMTSRRKSPLKGTYYHAFKELYKIKMFLRDKNIRICLPLIDIDEYRLLDGWSRDKKKGSHRLDRIPKHLESEVMISRVEDYMQFVPYSLPEQFTTADFAREAGIPRKLAGIVVNILKYVGCIEQVGKQGRSLLYEAAT